jgi:hypothetical protein
MTRARYGIAARLADRRCLSRIERIGLEEAGLPH